MKNKNAILRICPVVLAISSAYVSVPTLRQDYISVLYLEEEMYRCIPVDECDKEPPLLCKVIVQTLSGPQIAQVYDEFDHPSCVIPSFDSRLVNLPIEIGDFTVDVRNEEQ